MYVYEGTRSIHRYFFAKVEGMEVGVSMVMKSQNGSIKLSVTECSCNMEDLDITLSGGASWFYQVYVVPDLLYMHNVVNSFEGALSKLDFPLSARSGNHSHIFASQPHFTFICCYSR
jgi:hypothetical protein